MQKNPLWLQWFIFVENLAEKSDNLYTKHFWPIFFRFVFRSSGQKLTHISVHICNCSCQQRWQFYLCSEHRTAATCHKSSPELTLAWKMNKTYDETGTSGPCCYFSPLVVFVRQQQQCTREVGWKSTERVNFMRSLFRLEKFMLQLSGFHASEDRVKTSEGVDLNFEFDSSAKNSLATSSPGVGAFCRSFLVCVWQTEVHAAVERSWDSPREMYTFEYAGGSSGDCLQL